MFLVACSANSSSLHENPADSTHTTDIKMTSKETKESPSLGNSVVYQYDSAHGERFEDFFEKFKTDSVFQHERVQFPFLSERVNLDNDSGSDEFITDFIEEDDWTFANFDYDESIAKRVLDAYTQEVRAEKDRAVVEIRGVDNGIWIDYYFERRKGRWMLISEKDSSN